MSSRRWAVNAPAHLIGLYENRKISNGRELLGQLLRQESLKGTWRLLSRHVRGVWGWERVWGSIAHAKRKSKDAARSLQNGQRMWRTEERDKYKKLADDARKLASDIGSDNNPLDVPAYRLFPEDVLAALDMRGLNDMPYYFA